MTISICAVYANALENVAENFGHTFVVVITVRFQCVVNEVNVPALRSPGDGERFGEKTPAGVTGYRFILFKPQLIARFTLVPSIAERLLMLR